MNSRLTYPEIQALYGLPLEHTGRPHQPFKLKSWHVVGGVVILCFAGYGVYCFANTIKDSVTGNSNFNFKNRKDRPN